jgi:hypothetical protein
MRATLIAIALGAMVACKGKSKPKAIDAAVAAADAPAGPAADAGRPWYALPIDASPDAKQFASGQLPFLGGSWGAVELSAVDAPIGQLMPWLAADRQLLVAAAGSGVIRGYASGESIEKLTDTLYAAFPNVVPAPIRKARGKGEEVDLSFGAVKVRDVFRLLSDVERKNYVLGPGNVLDVDISAKRVPSDVVGRTVAEVIGRGAPDTVGNVIYVRDPAGASLDQALAKKGGPTVDIDLNGAKAGEAYALLAALGATSLGGADCNEGEGLDLRLRKVKAGAAAAVIEAVSGVVPAEISSCTVPPGERSTATTIRAIASAGKHRVVLSGAVGSSSALLDSKNEPPDTLGDGYILVGGSTIELRPNLTSPYAAPWDPNSTIAPHWAADLAKARLVATLIENDRRFALIEMADGTWQTLSNVNQNYYSDFQYTIGSGRLWFYLRQGSGTPIEGSLILQEK